jgi:hypothetical protein
MSARTGQLHSSSVDAAFVLGTPLVAIALGALSLAVPSLTALVLGFDLWFVSFPHVGSTFTRIAFTRDDARRHRWLLTVLPLAAIALAASLVRIGGLVALSTTYFFLQSFHYARQSCGIDRAYRSAAGIASRPDPLGTALVYLVPLWGVLVRCAQGSRSFLAVTIALPPVPMALAQSVGGVAMLVGVVWAIRTARTLASNEGAAERHRALYLLTHVAVFTIGYVVVRDLTRGWLIVNIWHNAQYLAFVWIQNRRRFDTTMATERRGLLAAISAPGAAFRFFVVCAAISTMGYGAVHVATGQYGSRPAITLFLVVMQAINFHHYVVDAVIWRLPSRAPQAATSRTLSWASTMNRN